MKSRIRKELSKCYLEAIKKIEAEPPRWETWNQQPVPELDWRLWDSVEILDMTLLYVREFIKKAKRRKRHNLIPSLTQVSTLIDSALSDICPSWKIHHRFREITMNHEKLQNRLNHLREAFNIYRKIYTRVSLDVEADVKSPHGWLLTTPLVWRHLRNAIYGIEKFLEYSSPKLPKYATE